MSDYPILQQASERGIPPQDLVVEEVRRIGTVNGAAKKLGCNPATIRRWLLLAGYVYVPPPRRGTLKRVAVQE